MFMYIYIYIIPQPRKPEFMPCCKASSPVLPGGLWQLALALLWNDLAMGNMQLVTISSAITACDAWQCKMPSGKWPFIVDFPIRNCDFPQLC